MTVVTEKIILLNNNESIVSGVYKENDNTYTWITFTKSGNCKKLSTAMKKINI